MARVSHAKLLPGRPVADRPSVAVDHPGAVSRVPENFLESVARDQDVQDWLISCSEREGTRGEYLEHLGRFLNWCGWTPAKLWEIKREALRQGEPLSLVETQIRRYHEALRQMGYAGKSRAKLVAAIYSFIASKGYPIPRKLIRLDMADKFTMRVPERHEIELFLQYAGSIDMKLLYTLMTETPCRPRVFPALRWNWLEPEWHEKEVIHIPLPKEFRPSNQSGPRKFEPICFLGPRSVELMKQTRAARIRQGHTPLETDRILKFTGDAAHIAVRRDFENLVHLGLIRPSRTDEKGRETEQGITPKSWRKYQFNIIDSLVDISPEWRKMLKGRDLQTERYYSKENIEELRKIYKEKIYPRLWSETANAISPEEAQNLRASIQELRLAVRMLEDASRLKVTVPNHTQQVHNPWQSLANSSSSQQSRGFFGDE